MEIRYNKKWKTLSCLKNLEKAQKGLRKVLGKKKVWRKEAGMGERIEKQDICCLTMTELSEVLSRLSEPRFRTGQVYHWLHQKLAADFSQMTDLPKELREKLAASFYVTVMEPLDVLISKLDGTRKYIFRLWDGNIIEAVLMRYHHGNSVCISTQAGCRMGCRFCASTLDGCVRNLTAGEMLGEVYAIQRDIGERVSNVVMMGSGEPLDNYEQSLRFIRMLSDENGLDLSQRSITLSTCGLTPDIRRLSEEGLSINLALSLHAASQEVRETIMPIAKAYPLREVLSACRYYYEKTGRRLTFEYAVVKGVNDGPCEAEKLAALLGGMNGLVNLIPVNPIKEREFQSPDRRSVEHFQHILEKRGIPATIRREMGRDISSACGQLRRGYLTKASEA